VQALELRREPPLLQEPLRLVDPAREGQLVVDGEMLDERSEVGVEARVAA
jgi:hypothetical protein